VAAQQYVLLREWQRLARGDPQLQLDEVDARDELGDRVLDLKPRVHLHEEEELVGGVARHDELDRPGAEVADAPRRLARGLADARARRVVGKRRRRLLDDLLMAALQRALALPEVHDVPVRVSEDLHFDVSGRRHVPLEKEGVVAEGCRGLAPRRRDRVCELSLGLDDMHPAPPADGLMSTGKPTSAAPATSSSSVRPARASPGTVGTPRSSTVCFAEILSPMISIASALGPMKTIPASTHARAKAAFSARKPKPGWIASAPVRRAASSTRSIER
jgi:hypothetical protein